MNAKFFACLFNRNSKAPVACQNKPRIKLLGDHSEYHAGCTAVIDYLKRAIEPLGSLVDGDDYDTLVVNGEGSMHHDSKNFRLKMAALEEAVLARKPAYLVNSVWQSNSNEFDKILKALSGIAVREQASHDDLLSRHNVESLVRLDVSYWAEIDESAARCADWKDGIVVGDFYSTEFENFVRWTGGPLLRHPYIDMSSVGWSSLVKGLRTASLLVTGRHHGVFAACRARTPFVSMWGNTHKIEGMVKMSGLPIPVCESPRELGAAIKWAKKNKSVYDDFFCWMDEQPRLRLADVGFNCDSGISRN